MARHRTHSSFARRVGAQAAAILVLANGCSSLLRSDIPVDGADPASPSPVARIVVDPDRPVLLRGVDRKLLPGVRVSSRLRVVAYTLRPGTHTLWLSNAPYGMPLIPQRLGCYVLRAELSARASYRLSYDAKRRLPVLSESTGAGTTAIGELVDEPLIPERGCRWR